MNYFKHIKNSIFCYSTKSEVTLHKEKLDIDILNVLENNGSWWDLYIRGLVPDYPIRKQMFNYLTERGVNVAKLEPYEIEDMTRWIQMRTLHGEKFPRLAHGITLEDKISQLKLKYPLKNE